MTKTSSSSESGISFFGALTLLFIGLKLSNVITWSWLWVLSPFWIPFAIGLAIVSLIWIAQLF